jgi:hypothetical protein
MSKTLMCASDIVFEISKAQASDSRENKRIEQVYNYPIGSGDHSGDPCLVYSLWKLQYVRDQVNGGKGGMHVRLMRDIDMSSIKNWTPIGLFSDDGKYNVPFSGVFDGNGHVIKNLNVDVTDSYEGGFFSRCHSNATITNLGFINPSIKNTTTNVRFGVVGGELLYSRITNVFVQGARLMGTSAQQGEMAGEAVGTTFTNCYIYGTNWCDGDTTKVNCYTLHDLIEAEYNSGKLAYLLNSNSSSSDPIYFQSLGIDKYPTLDSTRGRVYQHGSDYSNNPQQ